MKLCADGIIGHRGVPSIAPENTLGGFRKAAQLGVRWIELDVTALADGTPVVNHDATIDRCSDSQNVLRDMLPAQLHGINNARLYPDWPSESIPLLKETLILLRELGLGLNLELKGHGAEPKQLVPEVVALLRRYFLLDGDSQDRLIISSFELDMLTSCRQYAPDIRRGMLVDDLPADWQVQAEDLAAFSLHCNWRYLSQQRVSAIREAGYRLYCWTVNDPEQVTSLWRWGLDGVITDNPQDFLRHL